MPVNMNSAISFRQSSVFPMEKEKGYFIPMPDGAESPKDKVELNKLKNTETKKEKSGFRNFIGNVAKFFTTAGEMIKASAKALWYGSLTGGATLLGLWAVSGLPKQIKNKSLKKAFTEPLKSIGTKGKIIAGVATFAVASFHIIKVVLNSNQRKANVEHKLDISHQAV